MKAITATEFGDASVLELTDIEQPEPRQQQVRIAVEAAGINFGDIMQRRGTYHGGPEPPFVPGVEIAGVVDAVGEGTDYEGGDRVVALLNKGGYAEYAVVHESVVFDLPEEVSFEEGAGFPVAYLTAHNCLYDRGDLVEDERVLVHAAAGSVGSAAVQLARETGCETFGTASSKDKLEFAAELGCDHPINYTEVDFVDAIADETDDEGVDLVLDGVGGETAERSLEVLAPFGRLVTYGAASGEPGRLPTDELLFNNTTVYGYHLEQTLQERPDRNRPAVPELTEMLRKDTLEVQIGRIFDLEDTRSAHQFIESRTSKGKVLLRP